MPKSYELRKATARDFAQLKKLWMLCFDDDAAVVDVFFEKTVEPDNIIATFDGDKPINAAYLLECEIKVGGVPYKAFYIYAVCTDPLYRGRGVMKNAFSLIESVARSRGADYLFLVPANEKLFAMYEKLGFEVGFSYSEQNFSRNGEYTLNTADKRLSYALYKKARADFIGVPLASLGERAFNTFCFPIGEGAGAVSDGNGYALYETQGDTVTVFELFGDEKTLTDAVFIHSGKTALTLRKPVSDDGCGIPNGMYRVLNNAPKIKDAFFGIPYGV